MSKNMEICPSDKKTDLLRIVGNTTLVPSARPRPGMIGAQTREELVKLVHRLFLSTDPGPSVVVFSAIEAESGCSWTCARIAEILAERTDGLVCLIDANFRSKVLYREFAFQGPRASDDEWTFAPISRPGRQLPDANLWLLSYRPTSPDCPSPASIRGFEARIADLRHDFRYVLIDAPPLNKYADAATFGRMADGVVMILEANSTRREPAKKAREMMDVCGIPVLGAVLNKRVFPIPEGIYRRL